ncbi:hypothetical protein B4U80_08458 [Leptotrombidium deliense]|uniref:La-related protein 1 n=1 Tax=Leptotrombidium deliense TaxID=299467 RepID=A0A443SF69_9ACAR|nr:hypothetical protein B4U80_08458 [Leptotrombidium deliense]
MEESSREVQKNGDQQNECATNTPVKEDISSNVNTSVENEPEEKDEAQSSSGASVTSDKPAAASDCNVATRGNKKKGSKNRWRPLIIEPQSSKHHDRVKGQRGRRRDNSQTNVENGNTMLEEEVNSGAERGYRGSRRARGRGYSNFGRPSFRGRARNIDGNRSQTVAISDEYSPSITYYAVNYEGPVNQAVSPGRSVRNGPLSPNIAQTATAAYLSPTGAVPTSFISPYYTSFTPLTTPAYDQETLQNMIRKQIEYYFSEENLQRDFFLRRKMDSEGYLPVSLIASFQRVQALTQDILLLVEALESSTEVDLSEDRSKVRTKNDPQKWPIFAMRFPLSANETGDSVKAGDSGNANGSGASSDLHPDVPDFIPGQPYGYGYDGAQPPLKLEMAKDNGVALENTTKKVFCYADIVKKKELEAQTVFRQTLNNGENVNPCELKKRNDS